jgi:hypothetical protein
MEDTTPALATWHTVRWKWISIWMHRRASKAHDASGTLAPLIRAAIAVSGTGAAQRDCARSPLRAPCASLARCRAAVTVHRMAARAARVTAACMSRLISAWARRPSTCHKAAKWQCAKTRLIHPACKSWRSNTWPAKMTTIRAALMPLLAKPATIAGIKRCAVALHCARSDSLSMEDVSTIQIQHAAQEVSAASANVTVDAIVIQTRTCPKPKAPPATREMGCAKQSRHAASIGGRSAGGFLGDDLPVSLLAPRALAAHERAWE